MSKENPGKWDCDGKPDDAHFGLIDNALDRIASATSEYARANAHVQGPYDPDNNAIPHSEAGSAPTMRHQADFEDIESDEDFQLAQEIYQEEPEDSVRLGNTIVHLHPRDLAILYVEGRRSVDLVDIQTFASRRAMLDCWDDILDEAEE